jgi:hypothetical protein
MGRMTEVQQREMSRFILFGVVALGASWVLWQLQGPPPPAPRPLPPPILKPGEDPGEPFTDEEVLQMRPYMPPQ